MTKLGRALAWLAMVIVAACSPAEPPAQVEGAGAAAPTASGGRGAAGGPAAPSLPRIGLPRIVILGDSLTAGLGLEPGEAFPSLLQQRLDAAGHRFEVVNAGVSGDTTAGGLRRLEWSIAGDTRILVVALGANDGLRGLPVRDTRRNLEAIVTRAAARGIAVVLAGMEAPPNYGAEYTSAFRQMFRDLAREHQVAFVPFLLDGVAGIPAMNQRDGIHPNPEGARVVERLVWAAIEPLVEGSTTR